ncbi:hypothetical protein BDB01DRAFT_848468 [Pilobolus umbonatus]|nr:hypothetical protein BDB01DRAFT_848468 [Pilobolus umbonatus]
MVRTKSGINPQRKKTVIHSISSQPIEREEQSLPTITNEISYIGSEWVEPFPASNNHANDIYKHAIQVNSSMEEVADEAISLYNNNQPEALKLIVNFIIRTTGCLMAITSTSITQEDGVFSALQELQEELVQLPQQDYPIVSNLKENTLLRRNMITFFSFIIDKSQNTLIYDGVLIETLQSWLTTMSSSVYRPFRHTSTIIALHTITCLSRVGSDLIQQSKEVTTQLRTEGNKVRKNQSKIKLLKKKQSTIDSRKKDINEFLTDFVDNIFVHRSRDVESIIRKECLQELCVWMQVYPDFFIDNRYLRYFGWALNDPSANVRSEAIQSLIKLYKDEDNITKLNPFINRFKTRINEMALYDADINTHIRATRLCKLLYDNDNSILSSEQKLNLCSLIASDNIRIRKNIAHFINAILQNEYIKPLSHQISQSSTVDVIHNKWLVYKGIAKYIKEKFDTTHINQEEAMDVDADDSMDVLDESRMKMIDNTIDALWTVVSELQDLSTLGGYLCRDHSETVINDMASDIFNAFYQLSEDEEAILIHVYSISNRLAFEKGLDKDAGALKKKKKAEEEAPAEITNEISLNLVPFIGQLLIKHSDDASKLVHLVSILPLMNLDVYWQLNTEFEELLQVLIKMFTGANLPKLLENTGQALLSIYQKKSHFSEICASYFNELKEKVLSQVREACVGKDLITGRYNDSTIHSISTGLLRLKLLLLFTDATQLMDESHGTTKTITECIGDLLERATFGYEKEQVISQSALSILSIYTMWKCSELPSNESISILEKRRMWIFDKYTELIFGIDVTPVPEVRVAAFDHMIDLYTMFSSSVFNGNGLQKLKVICPQDTQKACSDYVFGEIKDHLETSETKKLKSIEKLLTAYSRAVMNSVFEMSYLGPLLQKYGSGSSMIDQVIKIIIGEFKSEILTGESVADVISKLYMDSMRSMFEDHMGESNKALDHTLKLARILSATLNYSDLSESKRVPYNIFTERIHIDGITFILSRVADYHAQSKDDMKEQILKFFKILNLFGKYLTRARDIARILNHMEDCLQRFKVTVEDKKEWEHYKAYKNTINSVLKEKGFRYDASKRANNAETPAAHIFDDVDMLEDNDTTTIEEESNKRNRGEVMDIDDRFVTKRIKT